MAPAWRRRPSSRGERVWLRTPTPDQEPPSGRLRWSATRLVVVAVALMCALEQVSEAARPRAEAQTTQSANVYISETAGVRRFFYPVNARVPFARGELRDVAHVRLLAQDAEVAAQFGIESRWPDGSVQWLTVDFNTSIEPLSTETYRVEYGDDVAAAVEPRGGLTLDEDAEAIQVGRLRFSKSGVPILRSARYRQEAIGAGTNGFVAKNADGATSDPTRVDSLEFEIVRRGPIYVELRYSGRMVFDTNDFLPFVVNVGMPNSKSWVRFSVRVDDPDARLRDLSWHLPITVGDLPFVWDFGTDRWTYGALRAEDDAVTLTNVVSAPDTNRWDVNLRRDGRDQLYETGTRAVAGWGHIQGAEEVVAFAMDNFASQVGTYRMSIDGTGQIALGFSPAVPARQHVLTIFTHFVSPPVQIGAATSPTSMLNPLLAVCELERYRASDVPPPPDAETSPRDEGD